MFSFQRKRYDEYYYRVEDKLCAGSIDEFDNCGPAQVHVVLRQFGVIKHTKCGAWIECDKWVEDFTHEDGGYYRDKRFILTSARKRFACPTIKEAKESFIARKERQKSILNYKINNIDIAIYKLYTIKE